jgi:hypothetical protein
MIELTDDARKHLDDYLRQTRSYLQGCKSVDAGDVEQNVNEHIENELAAKRGPISRGELDEVLERLGSPRQWVPEEELSAWRKVILRLRSGPEDWRLAYISFGLFILSFLLASSPRAFSLVFFFSPLLILRGSLQGISLLASFILARAAVSLASDSRDLGAQRWLLYPQLITIYVPVVLIGLIWPIDLLPAHGLNPAMGRWQGLMTASHIALLGVWWTALGVIFCARPKLVVAVFRPFADRFTRKTAVPLIVFGAVVALIGAAGFLLECLQRRPFMWLGLH